MLCWLCTCVQVQNRIDDIAMAFERLHAMVTGQDPLATALFFWRCLVGATGEHGGLGAHRQPAALAPPVVDLGL
jgi:hypothetical protein